MYSQYSIGKHWSVAQYNANNSWLYNGNNGRLNNNNKYNTNSVRALDYNIWDYMGCEDFLFFLYEFYDAYYICRKKKRNTSSQLCFEYHFSENFIPLVISVYMFEYIPKASIAFIIDKPRIREVIAADFSDRVVQTWYVMKMLPLLEEYWYDEDSYSCRDGMGGLRAALKLQEYIRQETAEYAYKAYIIKRDIRAFFVSIDPEILEKKLVDFIYKHFETNEILMNTLCYLTRIIYCGFPQEHSIIKSHPLSWIRLDFRKSVFGKIIGIPVGNITSQMAANFITSFYLKNIRRKQYKFVHYTDDTANVIINLKKWKKDSKEIERYIVEELHLEWHPDKIYVQDVSKGVEFLGYKIRYDRILPSDRIAHNFLWKIECAVRKATNNRNYIYKHKENIMQTINSYTGLLKWCNANRLKNTAFKMLKNSPFAEVYDFYGNTKVTIKKNRTRLSYLQWINKKRKKEMKELQKCFVKDSAFQGGI